MRSAVDDLGERVPLPDAVRRVVSLVPSLTETVAVSAAGLLVGATAWCTVPAGLDVVRVGGTKNPDLDAVAALAPDLVLANEEENRRVDVERLRATGTAVYVTDVRTVDGALGSLERLLATCGVRCPSWLDDARRAWAQPPPVAAGRVLRAVVPIWRRPWMAVGRDTFTGDLLARLGVGNVLAGHPERYPRFAPDDVLGGAFGPVDLVVLPDEPYRFTATDGPEAFAPLPCALVDGRSLTWYGPSLVDAAETLTERLRSAGPGWG